MATTARNALPDYPIDTYARLNWHGANLENAVRQLSSQKANGGTVTLEHQHAALLELVQDPTVRAVMLLKEGDHDPSEESVERRLASYTQQLRVEVMHLAGLRSNGESVTRTHQNDALLAFISDPALREIIGLREE